jgi:hypothetical protein
MNARRCDGTPPAQLTIMKKSKQRLALRAQTIRVLANDALPLAVGGVAEPIGVGDQGFIMKDTVIVPTRRP